MLRFAVRGGRYQQFIVVLGAALVTGALALAGWLLAGSELSVAVLIFVVLVPGGCLALGAHCLDIALRACTEYRLAPECLTVTRRALWGDRRLEVARSRVARISRRYARPAGDLPAGARGTWAVVVVHRDDGGRERELHVDGTHSPEEATWLRRALVDWARIPDSGTDPDTGPAAAASSR